MKRGVGRESNQPNPNINININISNFISLTRPLNVCFVFFKRFLKAVADERGAAASMKLAKKMEKTMSIKLQKVSV